MARHKKSEKEIPPFLIAAMSDFGLDVGKMFQRTGIKVDAAGAAYGSTHQVKGLLDEICRETESESAVVLGAKTAQTGAVTGLVAE